jgi:tetratricopeptide (TPR) repeat protein
MNKSRTFLLLIFLCIACLVQAKEEDTRYLLSKETYDLLNVVRAAMDENNYQISIKKLNVYLSKEEIKAYDKAVINQTLGYAYNAQEDYKRSIESFVKSVSTNALPDKVRHELTYIIAQLYIHSEKYIEGLNYLDKWFEMEPNPSANAHLLAASANYQINQFNKLIPHAKAAIEKSATPQQSWYELLLAGFYETKRFRDAALLLETMINKYPDNNSYWLQLVAVYQQNKQEKKALAVSELAYEKGILKGDDIIQLAQTYLYLQLPLEAAAILDSEINNGKIDVTKANIELLSNSWLLAHDEEKAAFTLERYVSKINDISLHFKLAHIYVDLENWEKAEKILETVVTDKNITTQPKIEPTAWLLLGISSYHRNNTVRSKQALNKALAFKETRDHARWWLNQIEEDRSNEQSNQS